MGNVLRLGIARVGLAINHWRTNRRLLKKTIVILILGLQGAGKSTVALRIWKLKKTLPDPTYVQTKGFNTYEIKKKNLTIRLHDLGGHPSVRELWTHYYADAHGIIFVVDSSKPDDFPEAGEILGEVLRDDRMQRKPVLVLANKQDDPNAVSEINLTRDMDLVTIVNSARCLTRVDICAANSLKMDQGIFNGFKWLQVFIEAHYAEIDERVQHESLIEQEKEKARFNLRRSEAKRLREEAELEAQNKTEGVGIPRNRHRTDDEEDGIDEVQKPGELMSMSMSIDDERDARAKPPDEEIMERLSPEGAADSTEDLKNVDTINSNTNANLKNANQTDAKILTSEQPSQASSTPAVPVVTSNGKVRSSSQSRITPSSATIAQTKVPEKGVDNPAFESSQDDTESLRLQRQNSNRSMNKRFSFSKLPIRNSAFSVRSNSTETDVEIPGEIILVTTKAEVHESQEMLDDSNSNNLNPNYNYDSNDRNMSPTFSYISGHISHKTSQESIVSGALLGSISAQNSAGKIKSRSRSSSASKMNETDLILNNLSKASPHPTPLQRLANLKSRNKTAPLSNDTEMTNHVSNGNILPTKKKDILH